MTSGVWLLIGTLAAAGVLGWLLRARDGRIRRPPAAPSADQAGESGGPALPTPVRELLDTSTPVTLVQLSTTFCATCRQAHALLAGLAREIDGLRHVELDVTNQPKVAAELGVSRAPTTLALAADGTELLRVGGLPSRERLLDALRPHLRQGPSLS